MAGIIRTLDRSWATGARRGRLPRGNSTERRDTDRASTSLLLLMRGANGSTTFTDSSPNAFTVTANGNAAIAAGSLKTVGNSASFDGSGDSLSIADATALRINGGDYTVECWIKTTQNRQYAALVSKGNATFTNGSWILLINNASSTAGDVAVYHHLYSGGLPLVSTTGVDVRDGNEHHIAWVRYWNQHFLFVDGVLRGSSTQTFSGSTETANPVIVGNDANFTPRDFSGNIGAVRITKGLARYIRAFTAPDRPFPAG